MDPLAQALQGSYGLAVIRSQKRRLAYSKRFGGLGIMKDKRWQLRLILLGGMAWLYVMNNLSTYPELVLNSLLQMWMMLGFF